MNRALEEKIKRLRKIESRLRKHAPTNKEFGVEARACKRTADEYGKIADWLEELKRYKNLEEQGQLLILPCKVGNMVYEIIEETVPNRYFYINEWEVQDVSMGAVKYADEWEPYDYENLYFTREEAEAALERKKERREVLVMVILAILIIVYIMIGYGLFLNTLSEEYIKSVWTPIIWFLWIIVLWLPYGVYIYLKERRTKDETDIRG